ncbi:MAG: UDP binding domain-containing protein, partial [Parvularculaceae bacterium]
SKVFDIVEVLLDHGIHVQVADPQAKDDEALEEYSVRLSPLADITPVQAVILAVPHKEYLAGGWPLIRSLMDNSGGVVIDVKGVLPREGKPDDIDLWRL